MRKTIRLTERDLTNLVKRIVREQEGEQDLDIQTKLDDIFFGNDSQNIFTPSGEYGYLSQERRLSKEITPKGRKERIQQVIDELESYIQYLRSEKLGQEDTWIENPKYGEVWGDENMNVSERYYRNRRR